MDNQTMLDRIFAGYDGFFASEKKIAGYIMENHKKVINMTIKELAKECSVSEASISRFCKKCGAQSFHHLKIELARERMATDKNVKVSNDIARDNIPQSLRNILANKIEELTATINMIDPAELNEILNRIQNARTVQVVAVGNTIPVAMDCAFKFNEIGIPTVTGSIWETQAAYSLSLREDDVLIAISNSGEASKIFTLVQLANERNVTTVGITNNKNSAIGRAVKYHIQTATREKLFLNEFCFSRISAATIIEILYLFLTIGQKDAYARLSKCEELFAAEKL